MFVFRSRPFPLLTLLVIAQTQYGIAGRNILADLPPSAKLIEEGQNAYKRACAGCHGSQAEGSDRAPQLAGSRRLRARSLQEVRRTIYDGIPPSGMPAFHLPDEELDALAAFVYSLNSAASKTWVPGSAAAGERLFFGKGDCTSCHMVSGRGKPIGPDLSNVANEIAVSELKDALLHTDAHITPGYDLVTVKLRNGRSIRGFARGRTNFDLQLQDLDGNFHLLQQPQIAAIQDERQSLMKPLNARPEELQDLIAFLSTLRGVPARPSSTDQTPESSGVTFERIQNPRPGDWLTYNGKLSGNRYSELKQINAANVHELTVKWMFPINHYGIETTPVVADGIMYVTGPNQAWALDALTGRSIWHYARPRSTGLVGDASVGTNRGVAILGDKVFMVMDNAHLIALNRITGHLVWDVVMPEEPQHYGSTVSPLIVKDTVIAGVSGGDWGIRGFVACFKASTGQLLWRRWTIPLNGEPGSETWKGKMPLFGGGSTWLTGAYDPQTDTLYWPTGNPWPDSDDRDRPGDNLYTNSILALNPGTGELKWHYQFTPHDTHDWDATEPPVLVDTQYGGKPRKLLLHADRNGIFYVLDRIDGEVLLTRQFTHRLTWTSGVGPDGRPGPVPPKGDAPQSMICPTDAANWDSAAFSPTTRLYYVLTLEQCRNERKAGRPKGQEPVEPAAQKYLRAINIDTGEVAWEIPQIGAVLPKTWPGVLGTAGNIIFYGDPNGTFIAASEREGKTLWHFDTNVLMKASPMTYMVDGKQFVAVAAGPNILCFGLP